jgi:hypothetical protein
MNKDNNSFESLQKKLGVLSLMSGFIASLYIFILSLPRIGRGIWPQSELSGAGLHITACLCALGLILISFNNAYLIRRILLNPLILFPLFIGLLSLIFSVFYDLPIRNILGSPQTGEGAISWLNWSIFIASAILLFKIKLFKNILIGTSILSVLIMSALMMNYKYNGVFYAPYYFSDFLAICFFCFIPLLYNFYSRSLFLSAAAFLSLILMLYITDNQAALAYGIAGISFFILLKKITLFSDNTKTLFAKLTLFSLPIFAFCFTIFMPFLYGQEGVYNVDKLIPLKTVLSRSYLIDIGLSPLLKNPSLILIGTGWGTFTEHVVSHIPSDWYNFTIAGSGQWEGISWDQFHSHNIYVDTLFSIGILGAFAIYFFSCMIPSFTRKEMFWPAVFFTGGFISVISFWFILPLNIPFIALALACMASKKPLYQLNKIKISNKAIKAFLIFILLISTGATYIKTSMVFHIDHHHYSPQTLTVTQAQESCPNEYYDYKAGGLHLSKLLLGRVRHLLNRFEEIEPEKNSKLNKEKLKINHLYCQTVYYINSSAFVSNRLLVARLLVQGELALGLQGFINEDELLYYTNDWQQNLLEWVKKFPARTDQAVTYLLWAIMSNKEEKAYLVAQKIFTNNPEDPVGLWFTGLIMLNDPKNANEGIFRMRSALNKGIERFMPIDEEIKNQLLIQ